MLEFFNTGSAATVATASLAKIAGRKSPVLLHRSNNTGPGELWITVAGCIGGLSAAIALLYQRITIPNLLII